MKNLRKVLACFFAIICLAGLSLVGCSSTKSKTITVIAYIDGVETERKEIDIFNNAILTEPAEDKVPEGKVFYGWSTSENWTEDSNDFVVEGNFISYNKVKDVAKKGEVKLYPAYKVKIEKYFVFGWYTKTATSGLDSNTMSTIETALKAYLKTKGATDSELALVDVRGYEGGVADYGAKIMKDGDVDVFIGCGNNIDTDGGVTLVKKSSGFNITRSDKIAKNRRFILLNYKDLAIDVYNWFQNYIHENIDSNYTPVDFVKPATCEVSFSLGDHASETAVAPSAMTVFAGQTITLPDAIEPAEGYTFAGWKVGETTYEADATVTISETTEIVAQYKSASIANVTYSNGLTTRTSATEVPTAQTVPAGTEITLPDVPSAKAGFVFAGWRVGTELKNANDNIIINEDITITAEYTIDTTIDQTITIGYWANTNGGFTESDPIITNVKTALETYLASVGILEVYDNITFKAYTGKIATAGPKVTADIEAGINVGVAIGFGGNFSDKDGGNVTSLVSVGGFEMGTKTGRYVYKLNDNAISNIVYDWMVSEGSTFVDAVKTPA